MPAWEDPAAFLADFGLTCVAGAVTFVGILNQPDQSIETPRAAAQSRQYELLYRTADVTLARGGSLTVAGTAYTVREAPRQVDDGTFSRVVLTKV